MKKSPSARTLTALGFEPDGVGFARVAHADGRPPVLEGCEFLSVVGAGGWGGALRELTDRHALRDGACAIVAEEGAYSLLLVEAPEVAPEELRAAVRWRIRELIDFHIDDAVIDVFDVPDKKAAGRPAMMYVVAARVPLVREKTELVQAARMNLSVVDIPELAQRNLAAHLPEDVAGLALLTLTPRSGLMTLTRQATLYLARRIDAGLERLRDGIPGDARSADMRTRAWLDTLVVEVQRSLDYYESNFSQPPISNLVIAPLAQPVEGMCAYLTDQLGLAVRLLELGEVIDCPQALEPDVQARCFPMVGAALRLEEVTL